MVFLGELKTSVYLISLNQRAFPLVLLLILSGASLFTGKCNEWELFIPLK